MRRRHFRVSLLVGEEIRIKDIVRSIEDHLSQLPDERKLKVTYIRQRPWWRFWR